MSQADPMIFAPLRRELDIPLTLTLTLALTLTLTGHHLLTLTRP